MSHRKLALGVFTLAALFGPALAPPLAHAADLDYGFGDSPLAPPPLAETKVEFGTGWYVRGDIAATDLPTVTPVNNGAGNYPGLTLGSGSRLGYTASLGGGYSFLNGFRADLTADFNEPIKTSINGGNIYCPTGIYYVGTVRETVDGGCYATDAAKISSYDVLVNAYYDFGTWYRVTPYVGAGVGLGFGRYSATANYTQGANGLPYNVTFTDSMTGQTFYNNYDKSSAGTFYNFAFAAMAGVAIDVYDHTKLDIGYRYLHLGPVYGANLTNQEVRAGLRYMIDR